MLTQSENIFLPSPEPADDSPKNRVPASRLFEASPSVGDKIGFLFKTPSWLRNKISLYWFLSLIVLTCFLPVVFTTFAPYDDEAYVMLSIESVLDGGVLYDEVHTQYGPAFYGWSVLLHGVLQIPVSHDAVRIKSAILLAVTICFLAATVWRCTGKRWVASATGILSLVLLRTLALEPGHPQELTLLLSTAALWVLATKLKQRLIVAASLVAIIALTKVNCGAILLVVFAYLLTDLSSSRLQSHWFGFVWQSARLAGLIALPAMVAYKSNLGWISICSLAGLVTIGIHEFLGVRFRPDQRRRPSSCKQLASFCVAWLMVAFSVLALAIYSGVSWDGLWHGLIFQHVGFEETFQHSVTAQPVSLILVAVAIAITFVSRGNRSGYARDRDARYLFSFAAFIFAGVTLMLESHARLVHGLQPRMTDNWLLGISPVVGFWVFQNATRTREFRRALGVYCCLSPLVAFPTPGTQMAIGVLPTLIALGVLSGDFVRSLGVRIGTAKRACRVLAIVSVLSVLSCSAPALLRWDSFQSLGLPGAKLVHLPPNETNEHRDLVQAINDCDAKFLAFDAHNHCRFFFWTDCQPLTFSNPTFWPDMLSHKEVAKWQQELELHAGSVCYVIPPESDVLSGGKFPELRSRFVASTERSSSVGQWRIRRPAKTFENASRILISSPTLKRPE